MSAQSNAPVIIKRKKVSGGDGHHGGAWKVAILVFLQSKGAFAPGFDIRPGNLGEMGCLLTVTAPIAFNGRAISHKMRR